jgi:hypothetical protein
MQQISGSGLPEVMSTGIQHLCKAATPEARICGQQQFNEHG